MLIGNRLSANRNADIRARLVSKSAKVSPKFQLVRVPFNMVRKKTTLLYVRTDYLNVGKFFIDCLHLLTMHQPGNELHIVSEVAIPGGSVDYFLVSTDVDRKVKDFVGIELQTMDTTGTVWQERELTLQELGLRTNVPPPEKKFGMNWKMTAKTILVQLHHKIETFESINKHLVLIVQDCLLNYIKKEFDFAHINSQPLIGDSMHFHSYKLGTDGANFRLTLNNRYSTDSRGISKLLGMKANALALRKLRKHWKQKYRNQHCLRFDYKSTQSHCPKYFLKNHSAVSNAIIVKNSNP